MPAKLLFEGGRVRIETDDGSAIWLDEGEALMVAYLIGDRLSVPSPPNPRFVYEKGFGPGDGDGRTELWCDAGGYRSAP